MKTLRFLISLCVAISFIACETTSSGRLTLEELTEKADSLDLFITTNYNKNDTLIFEGEDGVIETFFVEYVSEYAFCTGEIDFWRMDGEVSLKNNTNRMVVGFSVNQNNRTMGYLLFKDQIDETELIKCILEEQENYITLSAVSNNAYCKCEKNVGIIEITTEKGYTWKLKEHKKVNNQN